MYFSRIRPHPSANAGAFARRLCDNSYREHQMLWQLFGDDPDAKRDFLFRRQDHLGWPQFYLVSARMPKDDSGLWQIELKDYRPRLHTDQRLAFTLRANPVITRKNVAGKRKRHDIIMDLKRRQGWKEMPSSKRGPLYELIQQAGEAWLSPRFEHCGARLEAARAEGYQQHRIGKQGPAAPIHYSTLDLSGVLTVTDPDTFTHTLFQGIGPAKAFGCGLLLIRGV